MIYFVTPASEIDDDVYACVIDRESRSIVDCIDLRSTDDARARAQTCMRDMHALLACLAYLTSLGQVWERRLTACASPKLNRNVTRTNSVEHSRGDL